MMQGNSRQWAGTTPLDCPFCGSLATNVTVTLFIATSLDGKIAGPDDDVSWLFTDADYGYSSFYSEVDALVMGRGTYKVVNTFGEWPYKGRRTYVVSRKETPEITTPDTIAFCGTLPDLIEKLDEEGRQKVWLVGGGELVTSFLQQGLLDELVVSLHPVLLGKGVPLFPASFPRAILDLKSVMSYDSGLVQLRYAVMADDTDDEEEPE